MRKPFFLAIVFLSLVACKNDTNAEKSKTVINTTNSTVLDNACYEYMKNGDFVEFHITQDSDSIFGNLSISYSEKDASKGKFKGKLNGDKLIGIYIFTSEGVESSREIAFQVKDHELVEGYGEMNDNGTSFRDRSKVHYSSKMPLTKVDCK